MTGGASGIGRATCLKFTAKGDKVVVADFNGEMGRETVDQITANGRIIPPAPMPALLNMISSLPYVSTAFSRLIGKSPMGS
ncbi:SDR family NAD(P)-dependent oxidoreductase [Peribacillus frigoritolerans]|nr:SDR family NAD(P)-dependent oxidoreductase [Peribacillus frigoritolerans]